MVGWWGGAGNFVLSMGDGGSEAVAQLAGIVGGGGELAGALQCTTSAGTRGRRAGWSASSGTGGGALGGVRCRAGAARFLAWGMKASDCMCPWGGLDQVEGMRNLVPFTSASSEPEMGDEATTT